MVVMKTKSAAALGIKHLYHYQSFEKPERLARIFTEGELYFSRPRDFNDPWDCRPVFNKSALDDPAYYDQVVSWIIKTGQSRKVHLSKKQQHQLRTDRKLLESIIDELTSEMGKDIQNRYRVYCLSPHPDSVLMWAHYGASCRGVCLEFSVENDLFCGALPVTYTDSYPVFDVAATDADANLQLLLTKSAVWSYEDEFRVIVSEHPFVFPNVPMTKDGLLDLPKGSLRSVIVGTEMPNADRKVIRMLVSTSGWDTMLKVASLVPDRYVFEIKDLKV